MNSKNVTFGVCGRYQLIVHRADGSERARTAWSDNIITNLGIDAMLDGVGAFNANDTRCQVGSGNSTPALGNTALQSLVASSNTIEEGGAVMQYATNPKYVKYRYRYLFNVGTAAGNLSEVGIIRSNSPNVLISRALIKDSGGNPTTIVVLSDEFLDVIWEFFLVVPSGSGSFSMLIDAVSTSFNYDLAPIRMSAGSGYWGESTHTTSITSGGTIPRFIPNTVNNVEYSIGKRDASGLAALNAFTCAGTDTSPAGYFTTYTMGSYVAGSGTRDYFFKMPLNNGNHANGLNSFMFSFTTGFFQMKLNNPIMKVNTKTLELKLTITLVNTSIPTN